MPLAVSMTLPPQAKIRVHEGLSHKGAALATHHPRRITKELSLTRKLLFCCLPAEGDLKHSAALCGAGHGNFSAQLFHHLHCDGKAETEAAGFAFPALVAAVKAVENMGEVFRWDGTAEVLNGEPRLSLILRKSQMHPPAVARHDF